MAAFIAALGIPYQNRARVRTYDILIKKFFYIGVKSIVLLVSISRRYRDE